MKEKLPERKKNRLTNYDYSSYGAYFITICTKNKKNFFWEKEQTYNVGEDIILPPQKVLLTHYGKIAEKAIKSVPDKYSFLELLQYVVMPNHIHLILRIADNNGKMISSPTSIITVIGQMKRCVSKEIGISVWQRSFYDHIIRNNDDYDMISRYIYENPTKWKDDCLYTEG